MKEKNRCQSEDQDGKLVGMLALASTFATEERALPFSCMYRC